MTQTPASLLERLRQPGQHAAWASFVELYTPLVYRWARSQGASENDAADLVQEVLLILLRKLPEFERNGEGSFRGWLRTVTVNKWRETLRRRSPELSPNLDDHAAANHDEHFEESQYRGYLVKRTLEVLRPQLPPSVWDLFRAYVIDGRDPEQVAGERKVSLGTVYAAKSKVLRRLRQELAGLLDP